MLNADRFVAEYMAHLSEIMAPPGLPERVQEAKTLLSELADTGGRVMFAGNGASASIASHYALDFTKQVGIPALAFNDAPFLTAYSNDYGYEHWVARAVEHHGQEGDIAVLISTSGSSPNMVNGADACRERDITVVTFTGFVDTNPLKSRGHLNFWADSHAYNVVESVHAMWLGLICDLMIGRREYDVSG